MFIPPPMLGPIFSAMPMAGGSPATAPSKLGFLARLGLDDPRVRSMIAAQVLGAEDPMHAFAAIAQGPALKAQFGDEERERRLDKERLDRELEDRRFRRELQESAERRRVEADKARTEDRTAIEARQQEERDRIQGRRGAFDAELERLVNEGKMEKGEADLYRARGFEQGSTALRERFYPTEREKLEDEARKALIGTRASTNQYRDWRMQQPQSDNTGRMRVKDQIQTVNSMIDDIQAQLRETNQYTGDPRKREALEQELEFYFQRRRSLFDQQGSEDVSQASAAKQDVGEPALAAQYPPERIVGMLAGADINGTPDEVVSTLVQTGQLAAYQRLLAANHDPVDALRILAQRGGR